MTDERVRGRDYFTAREWAALPRVGSSGSSMVQPNACIHDVLFGKGCVACVEAEKEYQRSCRRTAST